MFSGNNSTIIKEFMVLPVEMHAMVLEQQQHALIYRKVPLPVPEEDQVLIKVIACGVCRTDLHIVDGELTSPKLPLVLGHEVVGRVVKPAPNKAFLKEGEIVGVPWLAHTCGRCKYCLSNKENLCENALFTGYTVDGGYAEFMVAKEKYCLPLPAQYTDAFAAPLLCAGLIGYRCYSMTGNAVENIGIYGFGAAAHIIAQIAVFQNKNIYAFTRDGDIASQEFAKKCGAIWAGRSTETPPKKLDAAIVFAPVGNLVPKALEDIDKGGVVVCGGIHMSDIPQFAYKLLWEERIIRSVANLTRTDGEEFLKLAAKTPIKTNTQMFSLSRANEALQALREGKIEGAAVLVMDR